MSSARRWAIVAATAAMVASLAGCGDDETSESSTRRGVELLEAAFLPDRILDLDVDAESSPEGLSEVRRSYLEAVRLYTLRQDDLLQATLQVGRFGDDVDHDDPSFRRALLDQVGSTNPLIARVGDQTVFLTTGIKQGLAVWFKGEHLYILGTRQDYDRPRSLLREVLDIEAA